MTQPFTSKRSAALALLNLAGTPGAKGINRRSGAFLGQLAAEPPETLSDAQAEWLSGLLSKNDLPSFGGAQ